MMTPRYFSFMFSNSIWECLKLGGEVVYTRFLTVPFFTFHYSSFEVIQFLNKMGVPLGHEIYKNKAGWKAKSHGNNIKTRTIAFYNILNGNHCSSIHSWLIFPLTWQQLNNCLMVLIVILQKWVIQLQKQLMNFNFSDLWCQKMFYKFEWHCCVWKPHIYSSLPELTSARWLVINYRLLTVYEIGANFNGSISQNVSEYIVWHYLYEI